jgi:hypothetical protein
MSTEFAMVTLALGKRLEKSLNMDLMELSRILQGTDHLYSLVLPAFKKSKWKKLILSLNRLTDADLQALMLAIINAGFHAPSKQKDKEEQEEISLRVLWLDGNCFTSDGMKYFIMAAPKIVDCLTELWLDDNVLVGDEGLRYVIDAFGNSKTLKKLGLCNCNITDIGAGYLRMMFTLCYCGLQHLNLKNNPITDIGIDALIDGLRYSHLAQLEIGSNNAMSVNKRGELKLRLKTINSKSFKTILTLSSARLISRIGSQTAAVRLLPGDLIRKLASYLIWPFRRHKNDE